MRNRNGAPIKCIGNQHTGTVFRVVDNQRRGYPNPEIAYSWDPKWHEFVHINCDGLEDGPPMNMNIPHPTPTATVDFADGTLIQCDGNEHAVYRVENNHRRWYPNLEIANSWSPEWRTDSIRINCDQLKEGPDMRNRNGAPIKCIGNQHTGTVFRVVDNQRRGYPNPEIAYSWDPKWHEFVHINCDGLEDGPPMRHKIGASIKCIGNQHAVFRLEYNQRRWYPNQEIADSWDPKWHEFVHINCDGLTKGPDMTMNIQPMTPSPF